MSSDDEFLGCALTAAHAAADVADSIIRTRFRARDFAVWQKADQTPVTEADHEVEVAVKNVLRARFPEHAFYGEEEGREGSGDYLWLIDPIDGTKAFVRGYPMFSTQIALMWRGELVLGVSAAGEYGERAWAVKGSGAFLDGRPISIADTHELGAHAAISIGNVKTLSRGPGWEVLASLIQRSGRIRGYGDFLHYHLLAQGCIDLVIESDVNILDIAALAVIVREAGGVVSDLSGQELTLETCNVLAGTPALHALALNEFMAVIGSP